MESLVTKLRSIQKAADRVIEQVAAFSLRNVKRGLLFATVTPTFPPSLKVNLLNRARPCVAVFNEKDFGDLWIFSDDRSSLQHLYNCIIVGDKAGVSILQNLAQIS
ncbi:hypothetical protein TNCV_1298361 [Trichonephila clavipes]|nr:hypothetical protein TNCV_1298361 [Trichonephila clavipes]